MIQMEDLTNNNSWLRFNKNEWEFSKNAVWFKVQLASSAGLTIIELDRISFMKNVVILNYSLIELTTVV